MGDEEGEGLHTRAHLLMREPACDGLTKKRGSGGARGGERREGGGHEDKRRRRSCVRESVRPTVQAECTLDSSRNGSDRIEQGKMKTAVQATRHTGESQKAGKKGTIGRKAVNEGGEGAAAAISRKAKEETKHTMEIEGIERAKHCYGTQKRTLSQMHTHTRTHTRAHRYTLRLA